MYVYQNEYRIQVPAGNIFARPSRTNCSLEQKGGQADDFSITGFVKGCQRKFLVIESTRPRACLRCITYDKISC